jgi:glycosyltransferase involved in cell wall biosynthesis
MKNLIILPAYNEEKALEPAIAELQALPPDFELLVVNDGSRDRTAEIAERLARTSRLPMRVIHLPINSGIGVTMQTGYQFAARQADYQYVLQFDGDGQHDASYIPALVKECAARQLDLCVGSRFLEAMEGNFQSTWARRQGIRYLSRLISWLSGHTVTDPTSGFRCAGPRAWRHFAERYPEDYPEPESLYWCARNRLRIGEVPVRMRERRGGASSIRYLHMVYYLVKVSLAILVDSLRRKETIS